MQDCKNVIIECYNFFYRQITGKTHFKLSLNVKGQEKIIDNFIKKIDDEYGLSSVGIDFIIRYFVYQFHYWKDKNTKRNIQLSWILGKKAFQRFKENAFNEYTEYYMYKENDIDFSEIYHKFGTYYYEADFNQETARERAEKLRFFNTLEGLQNCLESTSLYNPISDICSSCNFQNDCIKLLRENYYKLYKRRILNGNA